MIRMVADTNVYISALNFGGVADEVLGLARSSQVTLFISPPILDEIEEVLKLKFEWSARGVQEALALLQAFTQVVFPKEQLRLIQEDEPDNRILEGAVEANVDLVASGDTAHLQKLKVFHGIVILSPRDFLESRAWI